MIGIVRAPKVLHMWHCTFLNQLNKTKTYVGLAHENGFSPAYLFSSLAEASNKHSKVVHLLDKNVINMIWFLLPIFDWSIIMIGTFGFLSVVPTYL